MKTTLLITITVLLVACDMHPEERAMKGIVAKCKREVSVSLVVAWYANTIILRCDEFEFDKDEVRK